MSIIAAKAVDYTNLRIVTFGSDGKVPYTDTDGVVSYRSNRFANTYGEVNNSGFQSAGYWDAAHNTIIMRVRLLPGAVGMLFGTADYNISVSGTSLTFKVGSSTKTISCTEGWHIIGFLDMADGIGLYYDGLVRENGEPVMFSTTFTMTKIFIGKGEDITGPNVLIAKVVTCEFRTDTDNKPMMMHYYPVTSSTPSAVSCSWYETRYLQDLVTSSGTTTASGVAADYGIGIDDLREIFGSGYDNLLAIIADDGGANTDLGWGADETSPYVVTRTKAGETVTRNFAFDLSGAWVLDAYEPSRPTGGYLKQGRKPKWNIFHDAIKNGFTVEDTHSTPRYKLRYNLFRTLESADKPDIVWFEKYDTLTEHIHYPAVALGSDAGGGIQYTDGLPYPCTRLFMGRPQIAGSTNSLLFFADSAQSGLVMGRLGNLAPWNFTEEELALSDWFVTGWQAQIMLFGDTPVITASHKLTSGYLSKDTDAATKAEYQSTMTAAQGTIDHSTARNLYHVLMRATPTPVTGQTHQWDATIQGQDAVFSLLGTDDVTIDISDLVPSRLPADISGRMKFGQYNIIDLQRTGRTFIYCRSSYGDFPNIEIPQTDNDRLYLGALEGQGTTPTLGLFTKRMVLKLEVTWCMPVSDEPLYPAGCQCELIPSRHNSEISAESQRTMPVNWTGWAYNDGDGMHTGYDTSLPGRDKHNFEIGMREFFGNKILPVEPMSGSILPADTLVKMTIYDIDSAPITAVFNGNNWDTYNQTYHYWKGSTGQDIYAYRPTLDTDTPSSSKCAHWAFKGYVNGVENTDGALNGRTLTITRIHYETSGNALVRVADVSSPITISGSQSIYSIIMGGTTIGQLHINGQITAVGEVWVNPYYGGGRMESDPTFVEFYLDPNEGYYKRGDTFILEFTN